MGAIYYYKTV